MSASIIDLESLAQPTEKILANLPPWDPDEAASRVPKNYKKFDAIAGWLEDDKANHGKDAIEKAALNPETATIAIVGFWQDGDVEQLACDGEYGEADIIRGVFDRILDGPSSSPPDPVLGWNLLGFDLPMLVKRAWILGIKVPRGIFNPLAKYPVPAQFVDMMLVHKAGNFKAPHTGLNNALKAIGLPEKGDGKEFGKLWQEDRAKALEYNARELRGQATLYRRMGVDL